MKIHLPLALFTWLSTSLALQSQDLGNVMYIGDSITHGYNSASYRWALHKLYADNGITYNAQGINTGNHSNGVAAGSAYGGEIFTNVHSAQSSGRAWEISGIIPAGKSSSRYNNSNIDNWLGLSTTNNKGATYTGEVFTGEKATDQYFIMIGTNDLLSDNGNNLGNVEEAQINQLLGNMQKIVDSIKAATPGAAIAINTVPVWGTQSSTGAEATHQAVANYNEALKTWAGAQTGVQIIDVNVGLIDVATSKPFWGVESMFSDGLHPTAQGDLIIAGNMAKAMGWGGRTAGQVRKGAATLGVQADFSSAAALATSGFTASNVTIGSGTADFSAATNSSISMSWDGLDLSAGYTVDFSLSLGNGATDGWNTSDNFSVSIGNGSLTGTLNINEAYIQWGDNILFSYDMSTNSDDLRVAYVNADTANGLVGGYYVWLGDMLIGEALAGTSGTLTGVNFEYGGSGNATLGNISIDTTGSFAPSTSGLYNEDAAYISTVTSPQGVILGMGTNLDWKETGFTASDNALATSAGIVNVRGLVDSSAGAAGNSVGATITGLASGTTQFYANSGNYTGDVWTTIEGTGTATSWYGGHSSGTLTGDVHMRFVNNAEGGSTVFGAVNATTLDGNAYLEFSAANANFGTFTSTAGGQTSVAGSYQTNITGNVDIVINAGNFTSMVMGGVHTGTKTIGGNTNVYINGGTVGGAIMGGGRAGTIAGDTHVYLTGGTINSNVMGGGSGGTIQGDTGITIIGNAAYVKGDIIAGGTGGTIAGKATLTIKDVADTTGSTAFANYTGTLNGGTNVAGQRELAFDNAQLSDFKASITNFDKITATNGTDVTLSSSGGANAIHADAGSALTLKGMGSEGLALNISGTGDVTINSNFSIIATIQNTANLAISGNITVNDFTGLTAGSTVSYNDAVDSGTGNGYASGSYYITSGTGAADLSGAKIISGGTEYSISSDSTGNYFTSQGTGGAYYVNTGTITYDTASSANSAASDATTSIIMAAGTTLDMQSALNSKATGGITIAGANTTVKLGDNVSLSKSDLNNTSGQLTTLTGSGSYSTSGGTYSTTASNNASLLGANISASDWTGNVTISNATFDYFNLNTIGNANSTITLNGVKGYFAQNQTYASNIVLTDNGSTPAFDVTNGNSNNATTFTGSISGTGTFRRGSNSGGPQSFTFSGDVSGWTGTLLAYHGGSNATNFTFNNKAKELNMAITSNGAGTSNFNVTVSNAEAVAVNSTISGVTKMIYAGAGIKTVGGTAANTYTGGTAVNSGTVVVAKSTAFGTGATSVANGAKVIVGSTGLVTGSLTLAGGSTLALTNVSTTRSIVGTPSVTLSGALTLNANAVLDLTNFNVDPSKQSTYTLISSSGIVGDVSGITLTGLVYDTTKYQAQLVDDAAGNLNLEFFSTEMTLTATAVADFTDENVLILRTDYAGGDLPANLAITFDGDVWDNILAEMSNNPYKNITIQLLDENGTVIDLAGIANITINGDNGIEGQYAIDADTNTFGPFFGAYIPEPSTATLSLLALAGFAARRRRKA